MAKIKLQKGALSWALYDWANSAYATTVVAGFFPIFFGNYWSAGVSHVDSTFWLGISSSVGTFTIALLSPVIGAIADKGRLRKKALLMFAWLGALATASFFFVEKGSWPVAAGIYVVSLILWWAGDSLYNSLLMDVSDDDDVDFLSALGFSLGYLGGGVLFTLNVLMTLQPQWFGFIDGQITTLLSTLEDMQKAGTVNDIAALTTAVKSLSGSSEIVMAIQKAPVEFSAVFTLADDAVSSAKAFAVKLSFVSVAIWWGLFSLPLAFRVKEKHSNEPEIPFAAAVGKGLRQLKNTLKEIRKLKVLFAFLIAYWLYIDGVDTIITMAVKIGQSLGFSTANLITALLLVQFVGFPFAWLFGYIGQKTGPKPMIVIALLVYIGVTFLAYSIPAPPAGVENPSPPAPWLVFGFQINQFFALAFLIGTVQGGVQSLSRSMYTRLVPAEMAGEFFGFYNMLGKFAAFFGPLLVAVITKVTGSAQAGLLSLCALFIPGIILLLRVNEKEGQELARNFKRQ
ncbi:MAG: MFS transporter [Leptospiraceae bacterium]|nr:MFS transporter [Leptospiraceae bacterium]